METYLKGLGDWINMISHEEKQEVVTLLKKALDNWNSQKNLNTLIKDLVDVADTYDMYDMPDAKKFIRMIYGGWNPNKLESFESLLAVANSIMLALKDKEMAKPYYLTAGSRIFVDKGAYMEKNRTMENATELGDSACNPYNDKEFARVVYVAAFKQLTGSYKDLVNLAENIGINLKDPDMSREVCVAAFKKLKESGSNKAEDYCRLAVAFGAQAKDKASASSVIRHFIDHHAREFKDFATLVSTVTYSKEMDDWDLADEVVLKCKKLAKSYKDWHDILNGVMMSGPYYDKNFIPLAKEVASKFESEKDKAHFCEHWNGCGNSELDKLTAEIKKLSIEQIRQKYGAANKNSPANSAQPKYPLEACSAWIDAIVDGELCLQDPIGSFKKGEYSKALTEFEDIVTSYSNMSEDINREFLESFIRHIEIASGVGVAQSDGGGFSAEKQNAIAVVTKRPKEFINLEEFQNDKDVVMAALKGGPKGRNPLLFHWASEKLRDDKEFVMAAVELSGTCFEFASERLRGDKDVAMAAIKKIGFTLENASEKLRDDKDVVMAALKQDGTLLKFASSRLRSSRELVLLSISCVLKDYYDMEDLSELDTEQIKDSFAFLDPDFVRDVWANRNNPDSGELSFDDHDDSDELSLDEPSGSISLTCPKCSGHQVRFYQGVPAHDTYYAYEVDPTSGRPGDEVKITPRMDRVDRVESETFYLCHNCSESWDTWEEFKRACFPQSEATQANMNDLKAEYSKKIASGELDPAEVSYADFKAAQNQPKELNFKELYSKMIADGKIDPTETTFDEVQAVGKLFLGKAESEFKLTYSQGIGSGEIDPVNTTYDEIVRIAKFINEAAKKIAVPPPTTEELKKLYAADIGAGKIDPVDVSFEKFVTSYGK